MGPDESPAGLAAIIGRQQAEIGVLRYVLQQLCLSLPPGGLDRLIEALETPIETETTYTTALVHGALGRFADKLREGRNAEG